MKKTMLALPLMVVCGWANAQALDCGSLGAPPAPVRPTLVAPVAAELLAPSHQLGAPTGVLSQAFDEAQSVDHVLLRLRVEGCRAVASALPPASPASGIIDPATYKPRTQFDNTPWRFDMSQNGKRMTAEEFDAWMKARGVRVAKGKIPAAAPAEATPGLPGDPFTAPALPVDPLTAPVLPPAPQTAPPAPSQPSTPAGG